MAICWSNQLQPATFRGVPLWVKNDKENYGRRIVTHEFPNSDTPFNEDLGAKAKCFSVVAYTWGDTAYSDKEAIVAACSATGTALLQLPAKTAFMAVCKSVVVSRSVDEQCYFELTIEFVADPGMGALPMPAPIFQNLINSVAMGLSAALTTSFAASYVQSGVLPFVFNNAVARIISFSNSIVNTTDTVASGATSPTISQALTLAIGLAQNAQSIVRPGPDDPPSSAVVATIGTIFENLSQALQPSDAIGVFDGLLQFSANENTTTSVSPSLIADAANAAIFNNVVRTYAAVYMAQAVAATTFTDRPTAIQARADLAELVDLQMQRLSDPDTSTALATVLGYAMKAVSAQILTLAPVITVSSNQSLPNLYWAWRLYSDATRADQLAQFNNTPTPAFMPTTFEALNQ